MSSYDIIEENKVPTSKHKYLGIEIEFVSDWDRESIIDLLIKEKLENYCHLGDDGSIDPIEIENSYEDEYLDSNGKWITESVEDYEEWGDGFELRVLCTESELVSIMTKVGRVLRLCKAQVNDSCGLHVHLDMRNRNPVMATKRLLTKQNELFDMVPENRKYNSYCEPTKLSIKDIPKVFRFDKVEEMGFGLKRSAINLLSYNEHKTIEVRLHEGSVNIKDIVNWCKYLISIVDKKKISKGVKVYAKKRIKECSARAS